MDDRQFSEQFVQLLTENQNRIYGYIYSLLGNFERSADVLQETNLVLWRKNSEFRMGEPLGVHDRSVSGAGKHSR